jgi:DNA-binding transcriptional LysR family regulator
MATLPRTTLEQWAVLRAVVDQGSQSRAAEALHRSQSSVSYAIATLQDCLGVTLLEPQGRRAVLTEGGRTLLAEAAPLIDAMTRLEEHGKALAAGDTGRIRLIVDSLFPKPRLFAALAELAHVQPHLEVDLRETVRQTIPDSAQDPFDLAIAMPTHGGRHGRRVAEIELIAVVGRTHPLAGGQAPVSRTALSRSVRVGIRGIGPLGPAEAEPSGRVWPMSTVEAALAAVRQGLCHGWLPREAIADDLARGDLLPLALGDGAVRLIPLDLYFADGEHAPPSVRRLAALLGRP